MTSLSGYANLTLYASMAAFALAMIGFASYLAALAPRRHAESATTDKVLVKAGAAAKSSTDTEEIGPADSSDEGADDVSGAAVDDVSDASPESAKAQRFGSLAMTLSLLGTLLLTGSVILRGLAVHRWPLGNMFEFAIFASALTMIIFHALAMRRDLRWLGVFIVTPVLLVLGMASTVWYSEAGQLVPALRSYWLIIHVTVATISVALFTISAVLSSLYLLQLRAESTGRPTWMSRLPGADALERSAYGLNVVSFPLWTFTVIAGAIWARQAWGAYWNWDPKEVWSFIIWVVYAAYLHARATSGMSRAQANYVALAGFACILVNYGIVNVYFVSQHSYSGL